jgi:hypothetical protein
MIRKLRDDWAATRGGRAAWREFHDRLLRSAARRCRSPAARWLGTEAGDVL